MIEPSLILLVEDNEPNQLLASTLLAQAGYRVDVAGTSLEAHARLKVRLPDLILMDVQLGDEDGLALTRLLKIDPKTAAIPIVAVTAHAMHGDAEAALAAGCAGHISKPIDTRSFAPRIAQFLSGSAKSA